MLACMYACMCNCISLSVQPEISCVCMYCKHVYMYTHVSMYVCVYVQLHSLTPSKKKTSAIACLTSESFPYTYIHMHTHKNSYSLDMRQSFDELLTRLSRFDQPQRTYNDFIISSPQPPWYTYMYIYTQSYRKTHTKTHTHLICASPLMNFWHASAVLTSPKELIMISAMACFTSESLPLPLWCFQDCLIHSISVVAVRLSPTLTSFWSAWACVCMYVMYVCLFVCTYVCVCNPLWLVFQAREPVCVRTYVRMYVCMWCFQDCLIQSVSVDYTYIHTYTHRLTRSKN
jgi:hypothetical protein